MCLIIFRRNKLCSLTSLNSYSRWNEIYSSQHFLDIQSSVLFLQEHVTCIRMDPLETLRLSINWEKNCASFPAEGQTRVSNSRNDFELMLRYTFPRLLRKTDITFVSSFGVGRWIGSCVSIYFFRDLHHIRFYSNAGIIIIIMQRIIIIIIHIFINSSMSQSI